MKPWHWFAIAGAALAPLYLGIGVIAWKAMQPPPAPVVPGPVSNLKAIVTDAGDRAVLSGFYADFADVLKRDTATVTTTGAFRAWHIKAVDLLNQQTNRYGKYPALRQAVSDRIVAAIGLNDGAMDAATRAKLVDTLAGIAKELEG